MTDAANPGDTGSNPPAAGPPGAPPPTSGETDLQRSDREWGEQATAGPSGPPPAPGVGVGAASPLPAQPKMFRQGRSSPIAARGVLAAFGILGLLITLGLMAVLAVRVLDGADGTDDDAAVADELIVPSTATPGATAAPGLGSAERAAAATCDTDRATIETAMAAYEMTTGTAATSIEDLVASRLLQADAGLEASWSIAATGVLEGTGACAGA